MLSHSEISTYLDCQRKWELAYKDGLQATNEHFQFGSMAHKVLETGLIPDEIEYCELKDAFGIPSWKDYFEKVIEDIDNYINGEEIKYRELRIESKAFDLVGVIDLVTYNPESHKYTLWDYKFTNTPRTDNSLRLDEQLTLYAILFSQEFDIPLTDIEVGYLSIPKKGITKPKILKSGGLSKAALASTTYELYLEAIRENGLNPENYLDVLEQLKYFVFVKGVRTSVPTELAVSVAENIENVMKDMQKGYVLWKHSFMCERCEFVKQCKGDVLI